MKSFDEFMDCRVKLGKSQYYIILCLFLVDMNDGAQIILGALLNPLIKQQWKLNSLQVQMLSSVFYLGILLGSLISGKFADYYGRRSVILFGSLFHFIVCLFFMVVTNFHQLFALRFIYGFSHGLTIVLTASMFSEIITSKWRGKGLLLLNFFVTVGKIYAVMLAYIFLESFTSGQWRNMMVASSWSSLLIFGIGYCKLKQSARFLLASGQYQRAFMILNQMIIQNNKNSELIKQQEKQGLINWKYNCFKSLQKGSFKSLFNPQYRLSTITLCGVWLTCNFIYHGQLIILPFIFGKQNLGFHQYALTIIGQAPTILVSLYLIDKPGCGRKRSLIIFFVITAIFNFIFCLKPIVLIASLTRFFLKTCFQILYPLTPQSFGTLNRTMGVGICVSTGKLGALIMPFMIIPLFELSKVSVFSCFVIVNMLGIISGIFIPNDTLGIGLDEISKDQKQNLSNNMAHSLQLQEK